MKKIIVYICLLLCGGHIIGQNCVRNIRTKWDSAQNNEFAILAPTKINPWINTFNIGVNNGFSFSSIPLAPNANWDASVSMLMQNPFSPGGPSEYAYLQQPASGGVNDMDYHWEDGWEVMWLNLGKYPNGERIDAFNPNRLVTGPDAPANSRVPYIIMYNRYTGKLRVFANLATGFNAYHSARMKFRHPSLANASGMFRHMANYDQALDQQTTMRLAASANQSNLNNNNTWMSSDFQLGYDPCICNYLSNVEFRLSTVKSYDVDLLGRSVSFNMQVSAIDSPAYSNFLTNEGIVENLNKGSIIYKSFSGMLDDYNNELDHYNTRLKSYNAPFNNVARNIISAAKDGVVNAGGAFVTKAIGDIALRSLVMLDGPSKKDTATSKSWANEASKAAKGQLGKGFDFLSIAGLGKEFFEAPQRPSMPAATFSEMRIGGTINDSAEVFVAGFMTPGSYKFPQALTAFNYPSYNEVPGLFALIKTPFLNNFTQRGNETTIISFDTTAIATVSDTPLIFQIDEEKIELWKQDHKFYYRLQDPLIYKLNRALDFDDENTKLYVSLVVELENGLPDTLNCYKLNITNNSQNMFLRDAFPAIDGHSWQLTFESPWKDMASAGETLFGLAFLNTFVTQQTRTNFRTIDTNGNQFITLGNWSCKPLDEEGVQFHVKKVKLKIGADMYFNQKGKNGLQNNTFQTFTYLLYDEDAGVSRVGQFIDSTNLLRYKQKNLVLTNEVIQTTDPFVFNVNGTTIFVNAETIALNGSITVQSGFTAVLQATNFIKGVSGTTTIGRNVSMKNVGGFSPFGKIAEMTQPDLDAFCTNNSDGYKANIASAKWGGPDEPSEPKQDELQLPKTTVYPNPASNVFYVSTTLDKETEYTFTVYDLTGRTLINETEKGANQPQFEITTGQLVSGTYLLKITTTDGAVSETHRIVILK